MIDLHIHTIATPHHASWSPNELTQTAMAQGLRAIAVTDHNTLAQVRAALEAGTRYGIGVAAGVEIDSGFPSGGMRGGEQRLWHVLIYGVRPEDEGLRALCDAVFERNRRDAERLRELLGAQGFVLPGLDDLGRPANVADVGTALAQYNALASRAHDENDEIAGMSYILTQVPAGYNPIGVDEVIAVAHQGGGIAVLAHPGRNKKIYAVPATAADVAAMAALGLDGIEVFYPSHSQAQRDFYAELAVRHRLLVSAGSDSHHPTQPLATWPDEPCAALLERLGM